MYIYRCIPWSPWG